jgi:hypothetical protein
VRERAGTYRVLGRNLRERDYLESPYVDGKIIAKWIFKKLDRGMDWIALAQDKGK